MGGGARRACGIVAAMRQRAALAVAAIVVASLYGCYRPSLDRCAVRCTDTCPADLACGADNYCHEPGEPADCGPGPSAQFTRIAAGWWHVCGIDGARRLWCWGTNADHALGISTAPRAAAPIEVAPAITGWDRVSAGANHTCGIAGGTLYCWGRNSAGQTSRPDETVTVEPHAVAGTGWAEVGAGGFFTCGIRADGTSRTLWCWGSNGDGQLGGGAPNDTPRAEPGEVQTSDGTTFQDWDAVTVGSDHACGLRGGQLYCWGRNASGELGRASAEPREPAIGPVTASGVAMWTAVSAGNAFTCAIGDGRPYCWGTGDNGEVVGEPLGSNVPVQIDPQDGWTAIAAGDDGACGVRDGRVLCWGANHAGQLGIGSLDDRLSPATEAASLRGALAVAHGNQFACALDGNQAAWCWGASTQGQIGDGTVATKWSPTRIGSLGGWRDVAAGFEHTCAVRDGDGGRELYCWGRNDGGQLGVPGDADALTPARVTAVPSPIAVAVGDDHGCAIADLDDDGDGEMWCWGNGTQGQVGHGDGKGRVDPMRVGPDGEPFTAVVATADASCALATGGARWCWGNNDEGQLGVEGGQIRTPTMIGDGRTWSRIALGLYAGCGIVANDQLACWGTDMSGQRGDGPGQTTVVTPSIIDAAHTYTAVAGGIYANTLCAIQSPGGNLYCWGTSYDGQVGTGPNPQETPLLIGGASLVWSDVAVGPRHTCGVVAGDLRCLGSNDDGALGVDGALGGAVPVTVEGAGPWAKVSAGVGHTCAITADADHALYCWGGNLRGQLGDGTAARSSPTAVVSAAP